MGFLISFPSAIIQSAMASLEKGFGLFFL